MTPISRLCHWCVCLLVVATAVLAPRLVHADPVAVRRMQGTFHGFLVLKTEDGKTIASGDLIQVSHGDRVTARLTFRFHDGSLDEETTIYTQRKVFRLISDRHVQRGPSFPHPADLLVNVAAGQVTYRDENGKPVTEHFDLSSDDCNGLFIPLLTNTDPSDVPNRLPFVVLAPKPRLVHLVFSAGGEEPLSIGGRSQKATNFRLKMELGGVAGVVAPMIGRQPSDIHAWILGGEAPAFVRGEGQFYEGGPVWRIELVAPVFPKTP
jgi:hypothetical protein